ncbi:unnamed protein product [Paramecium pentaurelia]|uniref:Transmembrane protein n=1 Tax=Paramecium pentaurelia TaxID=43138 RepID=A0A8S1TGJ5_9CILI|nr:unnamed protein product [Paramecium pentaurelia]
MHNIVISFGNIKKFFNLNFTQLQCFIFTIYLSIIISNVQQDTFYILKNLELQHIHYLHYIMEIYIVNQQILFNIIIRKLYSYGLSYQEITKGNNPSSRYQKHRIYISIENLRTKKNVNLLMGGNQFIINSQQYHYEKKKYYLNKSQQQLKRFHNLSMSLYLCYIIWNYMYSFLNLKKTLKQKNFDKNFFINLFRTTKLQINEWEYNIISMSYEQLEYLNVLYQQIAFYYPKEQISYDDNLQLLQTYRCNNHLYKRIMLKQIRDDYRYQSIKHFKGKNKKGKILLILNVQKRQFCKIKLSLQSKSYDKYLQRRESRYK